MAKLDNVGDRDSRLEKLFGEMPSETDMVVDLPSEGRFYAAGTAKVTVTPIKFEDEKQLASSLKNKINPVNLIINRCVQGIDTNSLVLMDKLFLLLKVREISYGATYPASITCPKCSAESEVSIDLSNLSINKLPEDITDPREITLPKLKKKAKVRFPRVSDEQYLNSQEQIYNNIWRFISELDGVKDPVFISKAIPKMHIMDIKFIINHIMRPDLGLDPRFIYECNSCGGYTEMAVPITENFFSVTS
jgi:hypothetical protein